MKMPVLGILLSSSSIFFQPIHKIFSSVFFPSFSSLHFLPGVFFQEFAIYLIIDLRGTGQWRDDSESVSASTVMSSSLRTPVTHGIKNTAMNLNAARRAKRKAGGAGCKNRRT